MKSREARDESHTVITNSFQKVKVRSKESRSGRTTHECGKYLDPAATDAISHTTKAINNVAALCLGCTFASKMQKDTLEKSHSNEF